MNTSETHPILMYTTSWCGDCFRAKSFLRAKGVDFTEVDIEQDPEAMRKVMAANAGKRRVPTFEIAGRYYGNPPLDELAEALGVSLW